MNAKGDPLTPFEGPLDIRVFDVGDDVASLEVAVAVGLEPEPCAEPFTGGEVVGEVETSEPQSMLPLHGCRIGARDPILVPVEVPVVVAERQSADRMGGERRR